MKLQFSLTCQHPKWRHEPHALSPIITFSTSLLSNISHSMLNITDHYLITAIHGNQVFFSSPSSFFTTVPHWPSSLQTRHDWQPTCLRGSFFPWWFLILLRIHLHQSSWYLYAYHYQTHSTHRKTLGSPLTLRHSHFFIDALNIYTSDFTYKWLSQTLKLGQKHFLL